VRAAALPGQAGGIDVHYVSPSSLPSRTANSIHVVMQTRALADAGARVTLYARRTVSNVADLPDAIHRQYGVSADGIRLVTCAPGSGRGITLRIAAMAVQRLLSRAAPGLILSRNLYAAYFLGVLARRALVFETHDVETGMRGRMQRAIMRRPPVRTVAISERLLEHLRAVHGVVPAASQVLHDAAPSGIKPLPPHLRRQALREMVPAAKGDWRGVCGYFGHLYPGRGIELIESMAGQRPAILFLIAGGRDEDIALRRSRNAAVNLVFLGHLPHDESLRLSQMMDVLLMPYQTSVSLSVSGRDTARWMSPMKMFEYMATGVPIVSSDLPVLREILHDGQNALLVRPDDVAEWLGGIDRLTADPELGQRLGASAHAQYAAHHTWDQRARSLLGIGL
jgi:hypothetical protein